VPAVVASQYFLIGTATPPVQEGQWNLSQFIHIFCARAYREKLTFHNVSTTLAAIAVFPEQESQGGFGK